MERAQTARAVETPTTKIQIIDDYVKTATGMRNDERTRKMKKTKTPTAKRNKQMVNSLIEPSTKDPQFSIVTF